ncbi:ABC transporter ATP-binding protein [Sneathiella glossodoripedis]|uniref:ABC transporter ATP-binding protein n=1 Tax=Sneathiella glossodoripedis TaxID=418853 RepID=UPI00047018A1|nr:ABC transporter ATP-binding protein [Sneathiella glossodoripedis]
MAKITLENLAHSYMPFPKSDADFALKEINHVWDDGGAYALLGPSGCGKTTLLNIISGLLVPSKGNILFNEQNVTQLQPQHRDIAQVFQFPVIYDTMTVAENLAFPLVNRKVAKSEIDQRVSEMLEILELGSKANSKARGLTADEKQKISLGRGLVRHDVNAILFDEPLTVIDPHMKWQLRTKLKELHRQFEHTMIYVTHDQTEALTFADKVVVMYEGEVVQIGTPEELFDEPAHTFVGYFIGSPGMNVLTADLQKNQAKLGSHVIELGKSYPDLDGTIELGIRPEFVSLGNDPLGVPVQVTAVEDIGRYKIVRTQLEGQALDAVIPEGQSVPAEPRAILDKSRINIYRDSHLVREGV